MQIFGFCIVRLGRQSPCRFFVCLQSFLCSEFLPIRPIIALSVNIFVEKGAGYIGGDFLKQDILIKKIPDLIQNRIGMQIL